MATQGSSYIRWFREIGLKDLALVGGKNASLGELYRELGLQGVRVPNGFVVTARAYGDRMAATGALDQLHRLLDDLDKTDTRQLAVRSARARELVYAAMDDAALKAQVSAAYAQLKEEYGPDLSVAVRSSATAEDLPTASFAGQHESFLNISGEEMLFDAYRRCFASLFTGRAVSYRIDKGFDHFAVHLSVAVMKMVRSDLASSGVMFTLDTETGFRDVVFINAAYGLGENVVKGTVNPDEFYVHKPTFAQGHRAVLSRRLGAKEQRMVYVHGRTRAPTRNVPVPPAERRRYAISDAEALTLADYAIKIEQHYSAKAGHPMPMDIEWAKDGLDDQLYIVQARPETVASQQTGTTLKEYRLDGSAPLLAEGRAVGSSIAAGPVCVIADSRDLSAFRPGDVLVASITTPDWEPVMKTAAAIITDHGGRTCHAAIVARELGIPAVVGAGNATERLAKIAEATLSCADGDIGRVYEGKLPFSVQETDISAMPRPKTQIMVNLGNPELAFQTSFLPNDGVGLARLEFIISEYIKVHPMALVHPDRVQDAETRRQIAALTEDYAKPTDYFVERLSEGMGLIAAAFYPKPVIVRLSDFKTNEYAGLLGGAAFEAAEANPMLGFRGASRYAHLAYADGFALECAAIRRVREEMGLINLKVMVPFVRRVGEAEKVLAEMERHGLKRGANGLEIYAMCEIPNNVIQIDAFAKLFDGFSIGSNDLTQLVLGIDRDSDMLAEEFDERDPGVLAMIAQAVEGARRNSRHSGICGQAPSDYPEIAEFLVQIGIESISLNPDTVIRTTRNVLEAERKLAAGGQRKAAG